MYYYLTCIMYIDSADNVVSYFFYPSINYSSNISEFYNLIRGVNLCKDPVIKKVESGFNLDDVPRLIKELFLEV